MRYCVHYFILPPKDFRACGITPTLEGGNRSWGKVTESKILTLAGGHICIPISDGLAGFTVIFCKISGQAPLPPYETIKIALEPSNSTQYG